MYRPRIIPVLLLSDQYLVKTLKFKKPNYIGDPINAVRIFNDLQADELVFLDIDATRQKRLINLDFIREVGEEANMPFSVGGGITSLDDIQKITSAGAERVIIGSHALENPGFIQKAAERFGSSTISVCMDVGESLLRGKRVFSKNGKTPGKFQPTEFAHRMEEFGAGELIVQSIDRDGTMSGYDIHLIKQIASTVKIPVVALGGAGTTDDLRWCFHEGYASGVGAGSMFVYQGSRGSVLINYPENKVSIFASEGH